MDIMSPEPPEDGYHVPGTPEEYKEMEALKLAKLRAEIDKGLVDIAAGRTVDGEEAFKALRERLG
jgi:hypothetical protein